MCVFMYWLLLQFISLHFLRILSPVYYAQISKTICQDMVLPFILCDTITWKTLFGVMTLTLYLLLLMIHSCIKGYINHTTFSSATDLFGHTLRSIQFLLQNSCHTRSAVLQKARAILTKDSPVSVNEDLPPTVQHVCIKQLI